MQYMSLKDKPILTNTVLKILCYTYTNRWKV